MTGNYRAVQTLLRLLPEGEQAKRLVDRVIDDMGDQQHTILQSENQVMLTSRSTSSREHAASQFYQTLQRYCILICFGAFLISEASEGRPTFAHWMESRPLTNQLVSRDIARVESVTSIAVVDLPLPGVKYIV